MSNMSNAAAAGSLVALADLALACQLVQLELVAGPLDASRWPSVAAHLERMKKRDSFAPTLAICRKIVKQAPLDLRG
jgi:glutathione S-transferase